MIKKVVHKNKLFGSNQLSQARKECAIHQMFQGESGIVQMMGYTETDTEFVIFMEYCNQATYFEK